MQRLILAHIACRKNSSQNQCEHILLHFDTRQMFHFWSYPNITSLKNQSFSQRKQYQIIRTFDLVRLFLSKFWKNPQNSRKNPNNSSKKLKVLANFVISKTAIFWYICLFYGQNFICFARERHLLVKTFVFSRKTQENVMDISKNSNIFSKFKAKTYFFGKPILHCRNQIKRKNLD